MGEGMTLGAFKKFLALCGYPQTGAGVSGGGIAGLKSPGIVKNSAIAVSHTGDTNEFTLATIAIPAGAMGTNGTLRISWAYSYTANANTKTVRLKLGASTLITRGKTTGGNDNVTEMLSNRGAANSQLLATNYSTVSTSGLQSTFSVDTSVSQNLTITVQLGNAADTFTLESYLIEVLNQ